MGMLHFENISRPCLCAVYSIIIYTFATNFNCIFAEGVKIHYNKYFDGEELVTIYKISLQRCMCECNAKNNRCLSVNYKRTFTSCRLNVNKSHAPEELSDKPGSVYVEMDDDISGCDNYKIAANTDNSVAPFNQPACGKPPEKTNATTKGNVYSNGSRIQYACNERFKQLDQTESVTVCLYNESWSQINFICKPDTIGKFCSSNLKCFEQLSECKEDLCVCIWNHSYSLAEYACVPRLLWSGNYLISGPSVIPNDHFTASSSFGYYMHYNPWWARLDSKESYDHCGCWAAQDLNNQQYIQVNLNNVHSLRAVTTKGRDPIHVFQFVRSYKVLYSLDSFSFNPVLDLNGRHDKIFVLAPDFSKTGKNNRFTLVLPDTAMLKCTVTSVDGAQLSTGCICVSHIHSYEPFNRGSNSLLCTERISANKIFPGNRLEEIDTPVTNDLPCPIQAQYIRINPQDWHVHISLRFDVIGCTLYSADCDFENGTCGWQQEDRSLIQWQRGQPNNTEGGPANDHTYSGRKSITGPVTGSYIYITANQQEHVTAQLTVTIRESNVSRCLSLWHTASNNYSGSLNVITVKCEHGIEKLRNTTNTHFSEKWSLSTVRVENGVYQIVIEGYSTNSSHGILAIDDIKLNENDCP